jgi:hypothetical protein
MENECDRPEIGDVRADLSKVLATAEDDGDLYSEIVENILDVIFRQEVEWFVENKAKGNT